MFGFDYSAIGSANKDIGVELPTFKAERPDVGLKLPVTDTSCEALASFEELNETNGVQNKVKSKNELAPVLITRGDETGNVVINCYINSHVDSPDAFVELIDVLMCSDKNTTINIFLNSPGGYVASGISVCNAIVNSRAKVVTHATGLCASIAAVIWSMGDEIRIDPWARVMYHMPLHGDGGKSQSILDRAENLVNKFKVLCKIFVYRGLITEEEYECIVDKRSNLFLSTNVLAGRLTNLKPNINFVSGQSTLPHEKQTEMFKEYTMGGI